MTQRGWMKTRMIAYFILGVLIGAGFPLWAQFMMGGVERVPRGILWGLVTLTVALTLISMALRLRERLEFPDSSTVASTPGGPSYPQRRYPAAPLSPPSIPAPPSASRHKPRTPRG